jgi:hypothetical protein
MTFEDQLKNLRSSHDEMKEQENKLDPGKRFYNEILLPPLYTIEDEYIQSESAIYFCLEKDMPVGADNLPSGIFLVWDGYTDLGQIKWTHSLLVGISETENQVSVMIDGSARPGDYRFIDFSDESFKQKYLDALLEALQAEIKRGRQSGFSLNPYWWKLFTGDTI